MVPPLIIGATVIHRIGGLEITKKEVKIMQNVIHRIGGLETPTDA